MSKSKDKPPRFEESILQLEQIIEQIESGQTGLEESIALYERGTNLITQCRAILMQAEKKIAELNVDSDGKLRVDHQPPDDAEIEAEPDDGH